MSFTAADLYEIAKLFFPNSMEATTSHQFHNDLKRQYVVIAAIHEFSKSDRFFKVFGDAPMPAYTPPSIWTLLGMLGKSVVPASLESRVKNNHILRTTIRRTYELWWQNPQMFVN